MFTTGVFLCNRDKLGGAHDNWECAKFWAPFILAGIVEVLAIIGAVLALAHRGGFLNHGAWPLGLTVTAGLLTGLDVVAACIARKKLQDDDKPTNAEQTMPFLSLDNSGQS